MYALYVSDDFLASATEPSKPDHLLTLKLCYLVTRTRNRGVRTASSPFGATWSQVASPACSLASS